MKGLGCQAICWNNINIVMTFPNCRSVLSQVHILMALDLPRKYLRETLASHKASQMTDIFWFKVAGKYL